MTRRDKLEKLQTGVIDAYIEGIESGDIHARDMAPVISLLRQNTVVDEKPVEESKHSEIARIVNGKK